MKVGLVTRLLGLCFGFPFESWEKEGGASAAYSGNDLHGAGLNLRQQHQSFRAGCPEHLWDIMIG